MMKLATIINGLRRYKSYFVIMKVRGFIIQNNSRFTKSETKELRKLTGLAYERELAKALEALEGSFKQWRKNKITTFELSERIHKFHNGIARDLWSFYGTGHPELSVRHAITDGIILKTEVNPGILEKLK